MEAGGGAARQMSEAAERVTNWRHTHVKPPEQTLLVLLVLAVMSVMKSVVSLYADAHPRFLSTMMHEQMLLMLMP